jgi:broad specificity phosphatase PhoE
MEKPLACATQRRSERISSSSSSSSSSAAAAAADTNASRDDGDAISAKKGDGSIDSESTRLRKKTIAFMRHGESVANSDDIDVPDPELTELGRRQAAGRRACVRALGADLCICSPLLRAMETAAIAFAHEGSVPIEACRFAREKWWFYHQCRGCAPPERMQFAATLPRTISGVDCLHEDEFWDPEREGKLPKRELGRRSHKGLQKLVETLQGLHAETIVVVCHYGVIQQLTSVNTSNCDIVVCELGTEVRNHERSPSVSALTDMRAGVSQAR